LIKNFLANGCSFTEYIDHPAGITKTWATYLSEHMDIPNHINLASSGAGNDYICHSTINYLEQHRLDPQETLVIVMWSGTGRMDLPMNQEWYEHIKFGEYSVCKTDGIGHWINSGGQTGSWMNHNITRAIFDNLYKITDTADHCLKSLRYFVMLEAYLKIRGYKFLFTSFINYWQTEHPSYQSSSPLPGGLLRASSEPNIGYHCRDYAVWQNFDFTNWFFVNDRRDTICEYAHRQDPRGDIHPSDKMHKKFALEIVAPCVQQIHV